MNGWWLNQPLWKICSSNWESSPIFGVKIKNVWNHHPVHEWLVFVVNQWGNLPYFLIPMDPEGVFKQELSSNQSAITLPFRELTSPPFLRSNNSKNPSICNSFVSCRRCLASTCFLVVAKKRKNPAWNICICIYLLRKSQMAEIIFYI